MMCCSSSLLSEIDKAEEEADDKHVISPARARRREMGKWSMLRPGKREFELASIAGGQDK